MSFRESFYTIPCGVFLTSLTLDHAVGATKSVDLGWLQIPAGLLASPFSFLATDLLVRRHRLEHRAALVAAA